MRQLGIPSVVDRLVQQAILQVLEPILDPTFSDSSDGFRPRRSAHQAVQQASEYVAEGRTIVVDRRGRMKGTAARVHWPITEKTPAANKPVVPDLEKFFNRVNHDILMSRLARRIGDKRLLKIIRRCLQAGMMQHGVCVERYEGTLQGGPLSPLLANLLLDDLDQELERRGHKFCRDANDCNIDVRSQAAGERVLKSITRFLEGTLRLKVNRKKSAVAKVSERKFLGYRLWTAGRDAFGPPRHEQPVVRNSGLPQPRSPICFVTRLKATAGYDESVRWSGRTGGAIPPPTRSGNFRPTGSRLLPPRSRGASQHSNPLAARSRLLEIRSREHGQHSSLLPAPATSPRLPVTGPPRKRQSLSRWANSKRRRPDSTPHPQHNRQRPGRSTGRQGSRIHRDNTALSMKNRPPDDWPAWHFPERPRRPDTTTSQRQRKIVSPFSIPPKV